MKLCRISASILLVVAPLSAQAIAAPQDVSRAAQADASSYTVGAGDVLTVTVYRAPDYNGIVEVADDGTIVLNAIGRVKAAA